MQKISPKAYVCLPWLSFLTVCITMVWLEQCREGRNLLGAILQLSTRCWISAAAGTQCLCSRCVQQSKELGAHLCQQVTRLHSADAIADDASPPFRVVPRPAELSALVLKRRHPLPSGCQTGSHQQGSCLPSRAAFNQGA